MPETETVLVSSQRPAWPQTFKFGDFIRLVRDPELWGRMVGPDELPGRWVFEYPHGARVTADESTIEPFDPAPIHQQVTQLRFEYLAYVAATSSRQLAGS